MGATSKTVDLTAGQNLQGTANKRDLNYNNSNSFYNMLTGNDAAGVGTGLAGLATQQAQAAFSPYGQAATTAAGLQSERQRRAIEQRLAGSGILSSESGASKTAIAQAIAQPYAQANVDMTKQYGDMYQNMYSGLLGNLSAMSQQQVIAPQLQSQDTAWGTALKVGTSLGGALL